MGIIDIIIAPGNGAFFYDDQAAIRAGAVMDGFCYTGAPITPGFSAIRMPAASLSLGLVLTDGAIVWGDMMAVQYSGAAGRDPLFDQDAISSIVRSTVVPRLLACDPSQFLAACDQVFAPVNGARLSLAIEYGVSQALLGAAAAIHGCTMAEVICRQFGLPVSARPIPIFSQSGDIRQINVDKMVLKSVDILPHGLINSREKFGPGGETFLTFVRWVADRIAAIGKPGYRPTLHFDLYGWPGIEFGMDIEKIADVLTRAGEAVPDFALNIECPADFGSLDQQIKGYREIMAALSRRGSNTKIVVDERCNTLDDIQRFAEAQAAHIVQIKMPDVGSIADTARAVLICKAHGVGAYVGGSCAETDLSARASVHVAVATQADMMLAKPGMGVDEGISIVGNEQSRLLATLQHRAARQAAPEHAG
jgi:methylaspartate ammonia-lyase